MARIEINVLNLDLVKSLISLLGEYRDDLPIELQKSIDDIVDANDREKFKNLNAKDFMDIVRESQRDK